MPLASCSAQEIQGKRSLRSEKPPGKNLRYVPSHGCRLTGRRGGCIGRSLYQGVIVDRESAVFAMPQYLHVRMLHGTDIGGSVVGGRTGLEGLGMHAYDGIVQMLKDIVIKVNASAVI